MHEPELPSNWILATNDDLGDFINGFAFKPADRTEHGTPVIRIQNLTDTQRPFNYTMREVDPKYVVEDGDILVSWSATLDAFRWNGPRAYVNQHIFKVVPSVELNDRFVFFALKESINELTKSEHLHGTTMKHVNRKPFLAHAVGLPPLQEQYRIVEKIETLFAHIDKGEEALSEVQKLLKRYRQSILKAAVTGELTRDWREANQHTLEPASDLLARILVGLRESWQGRGKYKEPVAPGTSNLPELPSGWTWATLPMLGELGRGKSKHRPRNDPRLYENGTYSFLQTGRVRNSSGRISEYDKLYNDFGLSQSKLWPAGTVCITIAANIAESAILSIDACFPDSVVGLVPHEEICAEYVESFIRTAKRDLDRYAPATAQKNINLEVLNNLAVPLPPTEEQEQIRDELDAAFARIGSLEKLCEEELARATNLRQSILKSAFTGQLVPQSPNDEPASKLLARIRAERDAAPAKKRTRKKATKKKARTKA